MSRPSIQDVARAAGCSITTVSQALNGRGRVAEETRQKVLKAQKELGYVPNLSGRNLRMNRTNSIGLLFYPKCSQLFRNVFYSEIVEHLQEDLGQNGFDLLLAKGDFSQIGADCPELLPQARIDAAVLLGGFPFALAERLAQTKVPLLMMDNDAECLSIDSITTDGYSGGRMAVDYLWKMGHRRILFMAYAREDYNTALRERGFEAGLQAHGLSAEGCVERQKHDDFLEVLLQRLRKPKPPTAVLCVNDTLAAAMMVRLRYSGVKLPEEVSFIGFDDDPMAQEVAPHLTTIGIDKAALGKMGAKMLLERLGEPDKPATKVKLPVHLIERDSVARISP